MTCEKKALIGWSSACPTSHKAFCTGHTNSISSSRLVSGVFIGPGAPTLQCCTTREHFGLTVEVDDAVETSLSLSLSRTRLPTKELYSSRGKYEDEACPLHSAQVFLKTRSCTCTLATAFGLIHGFRRRVVVLLSYRWNCLSSRDEKACWRKEREVQHS